MEIKKGSFTIEAACVMSLVLFTVMGVLYLNFFVHNRVWLTAAAYEAAVSGSMEGIKEDGKPQETARQRGEALEDIGFYAAENVELQVSGDKNVQVIYELDTPADFIGMMWKLRAEGESAVVNPVSFIRKARAAADIFEEAGD